MPGLTETLGGWMLIISAVFLLIVAFTLIAVIAEVVKAAVVRMRRKKSFVRLLNRFNPNPRRFS